MQWTERIRIRQLSTLITLYESRNMTAAASAMGLSQPALSKWLSALEADMGVTLFARTTRGFVATPACDELIVHARAVVGEMKRSAQTLARMSQGATASLVIGISPPATPDIAPRAIHRFREQFPLVHLEIRESSMDMLLPQLLSGMLDFCVLRIEQPVVDKRIRYDLLYEEEMRVVVGTGHALAGRKRVDWKELGQHAWIGPIPDSPLRREIEHEFAQAGEPAPDYRVETSSMMLVATLLHKGDLVAAMSARVATWFEAAGQLSVLPLPYRRRSGIGVLRLRNAEASVHRTAFFDALMAEAALLAQEPARRPKKR
jgi:DNA-binding transcriptional LysR family regulator